MARDTTGTPESGQPLTEAPTAELRIAAGDNLTGRDVLTPRRPARMSARRYREQYDSTPHVVEVLREDGTPAVRFRTAGAVSAAVIARGSSHLDAHVTIRPEGKR